MKRHFGPAIKGRFECAPTVAPQDVARARARREEITQRMEALLRNSMPKEVDELRSRALPMLCIAGLARLPQVSLPLATLDGCPLGLSLIAAKGRDTMLLGVARALQ